MVKKAKKDDITVIAELAVQMWGRYYTRIN